MSSNHAKEQHQESESQGQQALQTGSTRFRNTEYAEQRESWPEEDDRR